MTPYTNGTQAVSQNEEADATKGTTKYGVVEVGGDRYPSLEAAQGAALVPVAGAPLCAILARRARAGASPDTEVKTGRTGDSTDGADGTLSFPADG